MLLNEESYSEGVATCFRGSLCRQKFRDWTSEVIGVLVWDIDYFT